MLIIFIRSIILYFIVVIIMRIMGKKQIGELQPTELVVALLIADLSSVPMENLNTPIFYGIIPILTLFIIEESFTFIALKSDKARGIIYGKPSILVEHGKIMEKELRKQRFNVNDLLEQMRLCGYAAVADVEFAILETSGQLSLIPKAAKSPVTNETMNTNAKDEELPITVIIDGRVLSQNLELKQLDEAWLTKELAKQKISSPHDVFFAYISNENSLWCQLKEKIQPQQQEV